MPVSGTPLDIVLVTASTFPDCRPDETLLAFLHQGGLGAVRGLVDALLARL